VIVFPVIVVRHEARDPADALTEIAAFAGMLEEAARFAVGGGAGR